ncbi:hypothetical protein ACHWQZ_G016755 [Mnemiopsis leidyi]
MSQLFKNAVNYLSGGETDSFVGHNVDIETHRLNIKAVIGDGGFGKVYRVTSLKDGGDFALKRLFVPESAVKRIQQELVIHKKVSGHPNICRFISGAAHPLPERRGFAEYLILLEYCPGTLSQIIQSAGPRLFSSPEVLRLFYGVCQAVQHLHSFTPPIIHRDIKAENVIISGSGEVKLCDYGSATTKVVRPTEDWTHQQRAMLEDEVQCSTTPCYRAPEMIDYYSNYEIGTKSDVWALGCFLYFICYFDLPYDDNKLAIVNAKYKTPNEHLLMFAPFLPVIRGVFKTNPDSRPSVSQIICLLDNIAKEKGLDPNKPPFEDFRSRISANAAPALPTEPAQGNNKSSWIGYLKGGAENILKEAKSASEKVVGAVVQASSMYSNDKLDEGQLIVTQVTTRIIAISFPDPSTIETVEEMVRQRHGNSAYFVNLTENEYFKESFGGRILNAGWNPLFPPSIKSLCHVVEVMDRWLLVAPENVLIVHCPSGTGNTALLLATYFLACGLYKSAISALQYYANCRYMANPSSGGIISASQKRYVEYIETMLYNPSLEIHSSTVILVDLSLSSVPLFSVNRSNCKPFLEVYENGKKILSTLREPDVMRTYAPEDGTIELAVNMGVCGDIRIVVYHARNFIGGKMSAIKMFQLCFNTSFLDPECASLRLPKSRLDGIGRNESKFEEKFTVTLSLSVQGNSTSRDQPYKINTSSLGIRPPVCCGSSEEFSRILSKTPDKGFKKADSRHSSVSSMNSKTKPKNMVFEDEIEDSFNDSNKPKCVEDKLINLMGSTAAEEKPTPMSDPISRKSPSKHESNVLLDFLAPATTANIVSSNSAPNLADLGGKNETSGQTGSSSSDDFSSFFGAPSAPPPRPSAPPAAPSPGHKRNQSINLMDIKSDQDDLIDSFDVLGRPKNTAHESKPVANVAPTMQMFDPFGSSLPTSAPPQPNLQPGPPDPFLTPVQPKSQSYTSNHIPSPLQPQKLGGNSLSGSNSPVASRSRNVSPRASPNLARKSNDPFSDFRLDAKTAQIHFDKPAPSAAQTSTYAPPPQPTRPASQNQSYSHRPNYFASTHGTGSVFGNDTKPWQQHTSSATNDAFGDLLSGQQFTSHTPAHKATLMEQRREELEKTMDPVKLRIMDWLRGKEGNIRALLSTLGDVLWDGESRWPKPGMHLMIEPNQVKKMYRNASRVVHPDKQTGTPNEELAKAIQTELNDAYTAFEEAELR